MERIVPAAKAAAASNAEDFTVSEIASAIKQTVENRFGHVRVRGEVSGYRGPHSSGHAYFSLKDDRSRIDAVIWRTSFKGLDFKPEEGLEVIATGRLTTYPGASKYQIVIDRIEPAGAGALMALLEARRKTLAAEGLFDEDRKRPLPHLPRVIGVVTSPTGAVIRDICHRITERFPVRVLVWPVRVQGETTGAEVSAAIAGFDALPPDGAIPRPDLLIVARGGGSLEDLWGFNDEVVVRAAAACSLPIISAIGHETDWTLLDHVADRRAPTPTAAAEMAVPVRRELQARVSDLAARLAASTRRLLDARSEAVRSCARALPKPDMLLALPRRRLDEASGRLERTTEQELRHRRSQLGQATARLSPLALSRQIAMERRNLSRQVGALDRLAGEMGRSRRERLSSLTRLLTSLSHQGVLERGFALVHDAEGALVKTASDVAPNADLRLTFKDGTIDAHAGASPTGGPAPSNPPRKTARAAKPDAAKPKKQGELF